MLKKLMGMTALLGISAAQAAPLYYDFEWKGFEIGVETTYWSPNSTVNGYFAGEDRNGDGIIGRDEITSFALEFYGEMRSFLGNCPERGPDANGFTSCRLNAFSYTADGELSFDASAAWSFGGSTYRAMDWHAPHYYVNANTDLPWIQETVLTWTQDTTLTVVSSVPEPSTWGMLGAGLLATAAIARRRKTC